MKVGGGKSCLPVEQAPSEGGGVCFLEVFKQRLGWPHVKGCFSFESCLGLDPMTLGGSLSTLQSCDSTKRVAKKQQGAYWENLALKC